MRAGKIENNATVNIAVDSILLGFSISIYMDAKIQNIEYNPTNRIKINDKTVFFQKNCIIRQVNRIKWKQIVAMPSQSSNISGCIINILIKNIPTGIIKNNSGQTFLAVFINDLISIFLLL